MVIEPNCNIIMTLAIDVDQMVLARGTPGFTGAELQNMVKYVNEIQFDASHRANADIAKLPSKRQRKVRGRST